MKVTAEITGLNEAIAKFEQLKRGTQNKYVRKAVRAGVGPQLKAARSAGSFRDDTGVLRRSLTTKIKTYGSGITSGVVGPRRQTIEAFSRTKGKTVKRNPNNYAHLVEFGHRIALEKAGGGSRKDFALKRLTGKQKGKLGKGQTEGVSGGRVAARPFLAPAFNQSKEPALAAFGAKFVTELMADASGGGS